MRITVDAEGVSNTFNLDAPVERIIIFVINRDADEAEAAGYRVIHRRIICDIGLGSALNVADKTLVNPRGVNVCLVIDGLHLDLRAVLTAVIHHLADERRQLVDGQDRAAIQLTLLADLVRPLLTEAGELEVFQSRCAVFRLRVKRLFELFKFFSQLVFFRSHLASYCIHDAPPTWARSLGLVFSRGAS